MAELRLPGLRVAGRLVNKGSALKPALQPDLEIKLDLTALKPAEKTHLKKLGTVEIYGSWSPSSGEYRDVGYITVESFIPV